MNGTTNITNGQNLSSVYNSGGQDIGLIVNVGIRWICATLGALSNFSLVYVTSKSKNLRSPCNLLIAFDSLYAGVYELSVTTQFFIVLLGINFIPMRTCLPLLFDKMVQCGTGETFPTWPDLNLNQMVLMGFTVLCYPAILAIVIGRKRNGTSGGASISYTRHMFKSLVSIVLVLLVGQSMSSITRMLGLQPANATSGFGFLLSNGQVCLKYLVYGCNAPLLYALSSEYRKAFKKLILCRSEEESRIIHVQTTTQGNSNFRQNAFNTNFKPRIKPSAVQTIT